MHHAGARSLRDIDRTGRRWNAAQAHSESKPQVTALALTAARAWPDVLSNAVDPGWVSTKMGGAEAAGDLELGYPTPTWLAVSNDPAATVTGGYWYHRRRHTPAPQARNPAFQDELMNRSPRSPVSRCPSLAVASSHIQAEAPPGASQPQCRGA